MLNTNHTALWSDPSSTEENCYTFWKQKILYRNDGVHPNHLGAWTLSTHFKAALKQWLVNSSRLAQLFLTIVTMSRLNAASNVHDLRGIGKHNVSHLIYVPLIAPNTSVYPTAIVSSNHELINQSYTVSTEAVCNSRKTTCRSPCTTSSNVNNISTSTSDKLPSKALKTTAIANYFNYFFIGKISKLRDDMPATNADTTHQSILDQIMKDKNCTFEFRKLVWKRWRNYCCLSTMTSHRGPAIWMENYWG
jgi:hypothetical protein